MSDTPKLSLYRRLTSSVPILVTVIIHAVVVGVAGYFVTETIIGKKKTFEEAPPIDSSFKKQVEHRLQVARKAGGSAPSPVSAQRIVSTAADALQLPDMPQLPQVGASSLSGAGFGAGMGTAGPGSGFNTGLGGAGGSGAGFMSMSFLGVTSQRASKIVFVVDVGSSLLDIRKGGFEAFRIIREEMMKLVSRLPPSAQFGVVVFEGGAWETGGAVSALDTSLLPATVANKERFFAWMSPINANPDKIGLSSLTTRIPWRIKDLPNAGLDDTLIVPQWTRALRCALELEPDTVYLITGSMGAVRRKISESELAQRKRDNDEMLAKMKREGLDPEVIAAARNAFLGKARAQFDAVNAKLKAAGKPPFIIQSTQRIFEADFQAALKRIGESIPLDAKGWSDKQGKPIWWTGYVDYSSEEYSFVLTQISQLQRALLKDRAALNIFLFVGPNEQPKVAMENLGKTSSRFGGKFELLTTKRLQELSSRDEQKK